jgi:hypothetical protein
MKIWVPRRPAEGGPRMRENAVFKVAIYYLLEQTFYLAGFCVYIYTPVGGVGCGSGH